MFNVLSHFICSLMPFFLVASNRIVNKLHQFWEHTHKGPEARDAETDKHA